MHTPRSYAGRVRPLVLLFLVGLLVADPCCPALSQGKDDYIAKLKEARAKFELAEFDRSIALLKQCLDMKELPQSSRWEVYELLALNYLARRSEKRNEEEARGAVRKLLELVPEYVAPYDSPALSVLVREMKSETPPPRVVEVRVEVDPVEAADAKIFLLQALKEELKGNAPLALKLLLGDYAIVARHDGFVDARQNITVNEPRTIRFQLSPVSQPRSTSEPWGTVRNATGIAGIVAGGCAVAFKVSANGRYDDYVAATSTPDAVSARDDVEKYNSMYKVSLGIAVGLLVTAGVIWLLQ